MTLKTIFRGIFCIPIWLPPFKKNFQNTEIKKYIFGKPFNIFEKKLFFVMKISWYLVDTYRNNVENNNNNNNNQWITFKTLKTPKIKARRWGGKKIHQNVHHTYLCSLFLSSSYLVQIFCLQIFVIMIRLISP